MTNGAYGLNCAQLVACFTQPAPTPGKALYGHREPTESVDVTVCNFIINVLDSPFAFFCSDISINMCLKPSC